MTILVIMQKTAIMHGNLHTLSGKAILIARMLYSLMLSSPRVMSQYKISLTAILLPMVMQNAIQINKLKSMLLGFVVAQ